MMDERLFYLSSASSCSFVVDYSTKCVSSYYI